MKLKPIVTAMIMLGLSAPAFAGVADVQSELDSTKAQMNKLELMINQNQGNQFFQPTGWADRITVSGMINVDGYWGNHSSIFRSVGLVPIAVPVAGSGFTPIAANGVEANGKTTVTNILLNNANIFVHGKVNDWVTADISLVYSDIAPQGADNLVQPDGSTHWVSSNLNQFVRRPPSQTALDQAYVTIGKLTQLPIYARFGKEYLPFGQYQPYALLSDNPTQLLTETRGTVAQLGFASTHGFYGSVYGFNGKPGDSDNGISRNVENFGADLGYMYNTDNAGFKLDVGYLYNMVDVDFIGATGGGTIQNDKPVGGISAGLDARYNAFDANLRYVVALSSFQNTLINYDQQGLPTGGSIPQAWGVELGYTFPVCARETRLAVGYQGTKDSSANVANTQVAPGIYVPLNANAIGGTGLPMYRIYGDYVVNAAKWYDVGFALYYDQDYSLNKAGTNRSATTGLVRVSVKLA